MIGFLLRTFGLFLSKGIEETWFILIYVAALEEGEVDGPLLFGGSGKKMRNVS